jgi:uncharacterized protein YecE (DUF72 family)
MLLAGAGVKCVLTVNAAKVCDMTLFIGSAGWTVPKQHADLFMTATKDVKLSHLDRYAGRLLCVEINSSFHRPHRYSTWERWAATTPPDFRFAVKAPKAVTHTAKLVKTGEALLEFFDAIRGLGDKLGPVLIQLPPKLAFEQGLAEEFFSTVRELHAGAVVLEPRHPSWFNGSVDQMLREFKIARVAADPPKGSELASRPGGWSSLNYWRLHGTPRTYYSIYDNDWLRTFADRLHLLRTQCGPSESWVIFDNTALGHATANAIWLQNALNETRKHR